MSSPITTTAGFSTRPRRPPLIRSGNDLSATVFSGTELVDCNYYVSDRRSSNPPLKAGCTNTKLKLTCLVKDAN